MKNKFKKALKTIKNNIVYKIYFEWTHFLMLILLFYHIYNNPIDVRDKMLGSLFAWPILLGISKWFRKIIKEIKQIQNREKEKIVKEIKETFYNIDNHIVKGTHKEEKLIDDTTKEIKKNI
mgnify:CR=1 FL=1